MTILYAIQPTCLRLDNDTSFFYHDTEAFWSTEYVLRTIEEANVACDYLTREAAKRAGLGIISYLPPRAYSPTEELLTRMGMGWDKPKGGQPVWADWERLYERLHYIITTRLEADLVTDDDWLAIGKNVGFYRIQEVTLADMLFFKPTPPETKP